MKRCLASRSTTAALALFLGVSLASCSSDNSSDTAGTSQGAGTAATAEPTPSGPDLCASADQLRTSLTALADVQVANDGLAALAAAWAPVKDDVAALEGAARAKFSDDVDNVKAQAAALGEALSTVQASPSAQSLGATSTAVKSFVDEADALVTKVTSAC